MKRTIWVVVGLILIAVGSISVYYYLDGQVKEEEYNGMFVDRSENNGYATMYDLCESV